MNIDDAIKILNYKIYMFGTDVNIGDLNETNIEAIETILKEIERLQKRNKEIYDGFMATTDELTEYATENERLNKALLDIKSQLEYLETFSSKEDVFEDMKRRLNRIEDIVNKALGSDKE